MCRHSGCNLPVKTTSCSINSHICGSGLVELCCGRHGKSNLDVTRLLTCFQVSSTLSVVFKKTALNMCVIIYITLAL